MAAAGGVRASGVRGALRLLWRVAARRARRVMADEAEGSPSDLGRRVPLPSQARRAARALEAEEEAAAAAAGEQAEEEEEDEEDEDEEDEDEENEDEENDAAVPWPEWYTSLPGNELYAEIDEEFLLDEFNLTGLAAVVPHYHHALDLILDAESGAHPPPPPPPPLTSAQRRAWPTPTRRLCRRRPSSSMA